MKPYYEQDGTTLYCGDCRDVLRDLPDQSVNCCVTSPPYYGLRDYGHDDQIGLEKTPDEYVLEMVKAFREVRRVLRDDGTLWLNIGDSYAAPAKSRTSEQAVRGSTLRGSKQTQGGIINQPNKVVDGLKAKDLIGIPWMLAFALRADGWYLRSEIIWAKPNGMPGSQADRCTSSHETIFVLSKRDRYYSDFDAIKTPPRESSMVRLAQEVQSRSGSHRDNGGRKTNGTMKAVVATDKQRGHSRTHAGFNERWDAMSKHEQQAMPAMMRDVWFVSPACCKEAHFAVMPAEIARRCILAGSPEGGTVLDPFNGSGTSGQVSREFCREYIGIELNPAYCDLTIDRLRQGVLFGADNGGRP